MLVAGLDKRSIWYDNALKDPEQYRNACNARRVLAFTQEVMRGSTTCV